MKTPRLLCVLVLLLIVPIALVAQRHRDPLTQAEINQVRDTSWEPKLRLPLYIEFARTRLLKLEEMRNDPKAKDRAKQTHDLLDDFQLLYDELNDNIDTYVDRLRKKLGKYRDTIKGLSGIGYRFEIDS